MVGINHSDNKGSAKRAYYQVQQMNGDTKPVKTRDRSSSHPEWQPEKVEKKIRGFIENEVLEDCAQENYRTVVAILHQLAEEIEQKGGFGDQKACGSSVQQEIHSLV